MIVEKFDIYEGWVETSVENLELADLIRFKDSPGEWFTKGYPKQELVCIDGEAKITWKVECERRGENQKSDV